MTIELVILVAAVLLVVMSIGLIASLASMNSAFYILMLLPAVSLLPLLFMFNGEKKNKRAYAYRTVHSEIKKKRSTKQPKKTTAKITKGRRRKNES